MTGLDDSRWPTERAGMERLRRRLEEAVLERLRRGETGALANEEVMSLAVKLDRLVVRRMATMSATPHRLSGDTLDA